MVKKEDTKPVGFVKRVRDRTALAVTSAFALVIGLVWLDVIKSVVEEVISYFGLTGSGLSIKVLAALLTTVICVIGILYFSRWSEKKN